MAKTPVKRPAPKAPPPPMPGKPALPQFPPRGPVRAFKAGGAVRKGARGC